MKLKDLTFQLAGAAFRVVESRPLASPGDRLLLIVAEPLPVLRTEPVQTTARLTKREQQVAHLLEQRATNREIAAALGISVHTARHHSERVLMKLGVRSRAAVRGRMATLGRARRSATDQRRHPVAKDGSR